MRSTRGPSLGTVLTALAVAAVVACVVVGASSCREPYPRPRYRGAGATEPHHGGTLSFGFDTDLRSLDPHTAYDSVSGAGLHLLYDTLVDYAPGSTEIVPSLASHWDVSPDRREYTFHLRPGVRFHSGRVLTADDFRRSFLRLLDPDRVSSQGPSFYRRIEGFEDYQAHRRPDLPGLVVVDPLTLRFRLTEADPTFLFVLAMPFAAPIDMDVADAADREAERNAGSGSFSQNPGGTGPFMLERWEQGARVVFRRNPHYWRPGRPYLDQVIIELSVERNVQFMRFQRGDLEYLHNTAIGTADYIWLEQHPAWRPYIQDSPDATLDAVSMDTERPPFNNVHLRRAVAFAIDRDAMCRARNYRIRPLGGVYPPTLPGYDPNLANAQRYDPAAARREMALAGYPDGLPGEIELWTQAGDAGAFYAQLIQADVARIGIHLRMRQASFTVFLETTQRRGGVRMAMAAWAQDFPDPSNFIEVLFHSRSIQPEESQNSAFYSNPRLDALLDRAHVETDRAARLEQYRQAERMVVEDAPWAFLYYRTNREVVQPYVRNYVTHPVWSYAVGDAWLDLPRQRFAARERGLRDVLGALARVNLPWSNR